MKKNEIMKIANKMGGLKKIKEREGAQKQKDQCHMLSLWIKFKSTILCFIIFPTNTL